MEIFFFCLAVCEKKKLNGEQKIRAKGGERMCVEWGRSGSGSLCASSVYPSRLSASNRARANYKCWASGQVSKVGSLYRYLLGTVLVSRSCYNKVGPDWALETQKCLLSLLGSMKSTGPWSAGGLGPIPPCLFPAPCDGRQSLSFFGLQLRHSDLRVCLHLAITFLCLCLLIRTLVVLA